jgi:hypothetical protein
MQTLAPPLLLSDDYWLHAFEVRFLLSSGILKPPRIAPSRKSHFLAEVPDDSVLLLNLLVGKSPKPTEAEAFVPSEFSGAQPLWRTALRNKRPVLLLGRLHAMNEENRDAIRHLRFELNVTVNLSGPAKNPYIELYRLIWTPAGGNVLLVVPMGPEGYREPEASIEGPVGVRTLAVSTPRAGLALFAPDGAPVGSLSLSGSDATVQLRKNVAAHTTIGKLTPSPEPANLRPGEKFVSRPVLLSCRPTIDGGQPRTWDYTVACRFDGTTFEVDIRTLSSSLSRADAPEEALLGLAVTEEIVLVAPIDFAPLRATRASPIATADLLLSLLLRDIRTSAVAL